MIFVAYFLEIFPPSRKSTKINLVGSNQLLFLHRLDNQNIKTISEINFLLAPVLLVRLSNFLIGNGAGFFIGLGRGNFVPNVLQLYLVAEFENENFK